MSSNFGLTRSEKIICLSLTLLYVIRMLGLFIILPVFSLYGEQLIGSTPLLMGIAFGSYAAVQMLLTPIFGYASDKYGRKSILIIGLLLFILGSLLIAFSNHIYMVLLGRIVQGSGAISAVILALATDLTREAIRTKIMATIGISIGLTFGLAMFLGPFLQSHIGMQGIFLVCSALGVIGILIVQFILPNPKHSVSVTEDRLNLTLDTDVVPQSSLKLAIIDPNLWRLYCGAFCLHLLLSMAFMVIPINLKFVDLPLALHWQMYIPCFLISLFVMGAAVGMCERKGRLKFLFLSAIVGLVTAFVLLSCANTLSTMGIALTVFFIGFNIMEATQPSLMARFTPFSIRGVAMGLFSSMQFLGAALGGIVGASVAGHMGFSAVYVIAAMISFFWLLFASGMNNPPLRLSVNS